MFCPNCKAEYREGFKLCSDCNLPLVDKFPEEFQEETAMEYVKHKELLSTLNPADIAFIKSLFDSNNIRYYVKGHAWHGLGVRPAAIMVDEKQYEEAKELLRDFKERFYRVAPEEDGQ